MKSKLKNYLRSSGSPYRWEWLVLAVLFFFLFASFCYGDTKSIIHYEVNFWESLLNGELRNFYQFSYEKAQFYAEAGIEGTSAANYDMPMYFVLGVWGAPLFFLCKLFGVSELDTFIGTLYGKGIFLVAVCLAGWLLKKLLKKLAVEEEKANWGMFAFISSMITISSVALIGQSDILGIIFVLMGICCYVDNRMIRFLICFMLAYSFKGFALLIFLPLLVLKVKNVLLLAANSLVVVGFTYAVNYPFVSLATEGVEYKEEFAKKWMLTLLDQKLPLMNNSLPVLVVGMGALMIWCYFQEKPDAEKTKRNVVFVPFLSMMILFSSFSSFPYWYLYLVPFVTMSLILCPTFKVILLETAGMAALMGEQYVRYYWCFDVNTGSGMLLDLLIPGQTGEPLLHPIIQKLPDATASTFDAMFWVCMLFILYEIRPSVSKQLETQAPLRNYLIPRAALNLALGCVPVAMYIASSLL